jgi:hypothetical protein
MKKVFSIVASLLLTYLLVSSVTALCGGLNLRLDQLKSVAVMASLVAHGELELSIAELRAPFEERLKKRGLALDQISKGNYVKVTVYIDRVEVKGGFLYIANISAEYDEQCVTERTKQEARCTLWEYYEPTETFSSPSVAKNHVLSVVKKAAAEFMAEFGDEEN